MRRFLTALLLFGAVTGVLSSLNLSALNLSARETISLDGTWQFATDPEQTGEADGWFNPGVEMAAMPLEGYAPEADGTIQVPGIWDQQGYGAETAKLKHNFVGHGWYKKTVAIPANWEGTNVFLNLGGISRRARVWVNGQLTGKDLIAQVASFTVDLTPFVKFGEENDLTIRIDSHQHWEDDAVLGSCSLNDYMELEWGGIWGHVSIESKPAERIDNIYLMTNLAESLCTATADLTGKNQADSAKIEIFDAGGQKVSENSAAVENGNTVAVSAKIDQPNLWTPDTPYLYTVRLSLMAGDNTLDTLESRYGMREFSKNGYHLFLNGKPLFLIGYGDDHIYPYELSMPTDKEMYKARLRIIKSFGFNHVRHHSTILPHEYYEACDEIGIMPTGEFDIAYPNQLPGHDVWVTRVPEGTTVDACHETYRERFAQVVREYRNHPCILTWVMGNEEWCGMSINQDMANIARTLDPQRFFCDSDGDWADYFIHDTYTLSGVYNSKDHTPRTVPGRKRDTLDIGFVLFNEWQSPIAPGKFDLHGFQLPVLSHESGNYITFSRPEQIDLFENGQFEGNPSLAGDPNKKLTCTFKPFWMTDGAKKIKDLGFSDEEIEDWAKVSEEMYYIHHKYNVEGVRVNPEISGYHWWLIQDYWTTSNGLLDLFFRPKSIAPERVRIFNSPLVLLQKGLELTYKSGDTASASLLISNFTGQAVSGKLTFAFLLGDEEESKTVSIYDVQPGNVQNITYCSFSIPEVENPVPLTVSVKLTDNDGNVIQTNQWKAEVYPNSTEFRTGGKTVYASDDLMELLPDADLEPIPADDQLPADAVYLVSYLEPRLADALDAGAGVVLLDGSALYDGVGIQYQQTWWKGGDSDSSNHVGTYVYDTPLTRALGIGNWCDPGWYYLLNGASKFYLEQKPVRPNVQIRALPSLVRVQDTAVLFDVNVGKGTLVVSGLNHQGAKDRPENAGVLRALVEYAANEQSPVSWTRNEVMPVTQVPEGTVLGFTRTLPSNFENMIWKNWRTDAARNFTCRSTSRENYLSWQTAAAPADADSVTFIFAGGLGYSSQPATDGFALEINDKAALTFNLPAADASAAEWTGEEGVVLSMEILKRDPEDAFGRFSLTVPKVFLSGSNAGEKITVRSLGEGSRRWFALNPITDLVD